MTVQSNVSTHTDRQAIKAEANPDEVLFAQNEHSPEEGHEHPHLRGALMVALIFLVVLIAFWGYMYALLLLRGA